MSYDDLHSSNGRPATAIVDVALLASLVEKGKEIPANDSGLSELLAHLDSADTMASGVETKLDGILHVLDNLLACLEPMDSDKPREATIPPSESQSEHPTSDQSREHDST